MISILPLPEWVPLWVHAAILCAAGVVGLAFLMLPFSVFGTKARLEAIEARLDEIQGEIRSLALRLPEQAAAPDGPDAGYAPARPPIPPAPLLPGPRERPVPDPVLPRRSGRTEPRLY